ncbi:hypothetical protein U9M48_017107 [Paspalum notatum var. saurae]|uniref:No apical meristem-associated C-terminal domain-containing protein n=1 Tax=Paspalum notatum var. saurae TaxID=547442 RepID=A0AAQ3WNI2_PASNO
MDHFWENNTGAIDLNEDSQSQEFGGFGFNNDSVPLRSLLNMNNCSVPNTSFHPTMPCSSPIDLEAESSPSPHLQQTSDSVTPSSFHTEYPTPASMIPRQSRPPCSSKAKGKKKTPETSEGLSHRTSNYTVEEDLCLISAWLNVSRDPIVGTNQSHDAYWERIYGYYLEHKPASSQRNKKSLNRRPPTMSANRVTMAKSIAIFDSENPKGKWSYTHCWEALRNTKKWEDFKSEKASQKLKGLNLNTALEEEVAPGDIPRPMGRGCDAPASQVHNHTSYMKHHP